MALLRLHPQSRDWVATINAIGPQFAARAAAHDADGAFVAGNYAELRTAGVFAAGVPLDLGGFGASHAELCSMMRTLAGFCASTALALSMHTHQVATAAWRWRNEAAPVEGLLKRVAAENLVIASTGGGDWLDGSGTARRVDGEYRISGRKRFVSGAPGADIMMTSAVLEEASGAPSTVLHFGVPLRGAAESDVRIEETWDTLGMRGTGSHDVILENAFVPEQAIGGRRRQGAWHPLFHTLSMIAFPLVYSVYLGIAESAAEIATGYARQRRDDPLVQQLVGELRNEIALARLAVAEMVNLAATAKPGPETTNAVFINRSLAGEASVRAAEKAMEVGGGGSFYRRTTLERHFRDVQAARYHPLQRKDQLALAGRLALGLPIDR